ncbi:hypothetical protein NIE88_07555 [Sporolactobacillus shoreicorticis]|uniref:Uncharacterized protein n=1 Tax=Sporolactobacillus shoreicorticis TaxID=1923877 RepID=A0ABW5S5Q9_9BACL|nr:hypothetical protein [Sporolactobacillus shoreicorticis]MCO7125625.1 hypothetical protein [Sporolactobacillus shoreicorticis]
MKTLTFGNTQFVAEKIIKTSSDIIGLNGNNVAFSFNGISDFSKFTLGEGQEFDSEPATAEQQQISQILADQAKMKQDIDLLKQDIADLKGDATQ